MAIDSQDTIDHQRTVDGTKHRGLIDPTCIFDPEIILLSSQRAGFRLLFPDWDEKSIFDRPTILEMRRILKDVDLTKITQRSVILADTALTPAPDAASTKKDSTCYRKFSRVPLDANACNTSLSATDKKRKGRAFQSRHGQITIQDIVGVVHYLKGCIATGKLGFYTDIFTTGLMATQLSDIQFAFEPNERETLKESLLRAGSGSVQDNKDAADAILAAVGFHDNDDVEGAALVSRAGFCFIDLAKNYLMYEDYMLDDVTIKTVENWLSGDIVQRCILCEIIASHLFGGAYCHGNKCDQISLSGTIKDTVTYQLFGPSKLRKIKFPKRDITLEDLMANYNVQVYDFPKFSVNHDDHKVIIGKFSYVQMNVALSLCPDGNWADRMIPCPAQDLLRIYAGLYSTPSSFKLAIDMDLIDYDNFTAVTRALTTFGLHCRSDAVTSQHGYEYAKLCHDFHSWPKQIMRAASRATCW
ncbi:hypothetical protein BC940DRAFT_293398 [Gongronella butleri]|nr:hypothetical protein BC940DRAFT_293398 [Gongronella butleri]